MGTPVVEWAFSQSGAMRATSNFERKKLDSASKPKRAHNRL